jgi:hypothetical protein
VVYITEIPKDLDRYTYAFAGAIDYDLEGLNFCGVWHIPNDRHQVLHDHMGRHDLQQPKGVFSFRREWAPL